MEPYFGTPLAFLPPQPNHLYRFCWKRNDQMMLQNFTPTLYPAPQTTTACLSPGSDTSKSFSSQEPQGTLKLPRPFKSFPNDSLQLAIGVSTKENFLGSQSSMEAYSEFRNKILSQMQTNNNLSTNMRRNQMQSGKSSDPEYLEKRRKNNEAARRSREARKAKEDEIAIRCAFLEQENIHLKFRLAALESERSKLQKMLQY